MAHKPNCISHEKNLQIKCDSAKFSILPNLTSNPRIPPIHLTEAFVFKLWLVRKGKAQLEISYLDNLPSLGKSRLCASQAVNMRWGC